MFCNFHSLLLGKRQVVRHGVGLDVGINPCQALGGSGTVGVQRPRLVEHLGGLAHFSSKADHLKDIAGQPEGCQRLGARHFLG